MKFRKKPVIIDAEQFFPNEGRIPAGVFSSGLGDPRKRHDLDWEIDTLEGRMIVHNGDWIITDVKGEKYACKPDIFLMTYEPVLHAEDGMSFQQ